MSTEITVDSTASLVYDAVDFKQVLEDNLETLQDFAANHGKTLDLDVAYYATWIADNLNNDDNINYAIRMNILESFKELILDE